MSSEREERILDATLELVLRFGYDKTTVQEIATLAGVSKGSIYLDFRSKEDLFESLLVRESLRHAQRWLQCVEEDPRGGTIGGLYKATLRSKRASPLIQALLQRNPDTMGSYLRSKDSLFASATSKTLRAEFVVAMQEAGVMVDDVAPDLVAAVMDMIGFGLVGLVELRPAASMPDVDETIEFIAELFDTRLTPEGADSEKGKAIVREAVAQAGIRLSAYLDEKRRGSEG